MKVIKFLGFIIGSVVTSFFRAWSMVWIWNNLLASGYDLPNLTIISAIGISAIDSMMSARIPSNEVEEKGISYAFFFSNAVTAFCLLSAFLWNYAIN